ncbi:trypsin-like serine protease [Streptomyces sp. NPDC002668]|uniref:trypsin-like serine protease n=1 Tax=Streptomyces sp. NPDC002668 TaxID=3154422 RepID=UPI003333B006
MRIAVPAAAAVIALVGTGVAMSGSQAAEAGQQPKISYDATKPTAPSTKELRERVIDAMVADARDTKAPREAATNAPTRDPRIIGGSETTISTAPWMAQVHYTDDMGTPDDTTDDLGYFCGGVVIAPTKVATAAHCVKGRKFYQGGAIITGTDQLPTQDTAGNWDFHGGKLVGAYRQWNHPGYSSATIDNDVAVLTLTEPVAVKPLKIVQPTDSAVYTPGTDAKVYGWGRTSSTEPGISQTLKTADADINSNSTCSAAYPGGFIAGHMVCAGAPPTGSDATSETACNGDSGGPLVAGGKLVGLVSWGDVNCSAAGKYTVYAKVSTYSAQIQSRADDTNWNNDHTADLLARRASDSTLFGWTSKVTGLTRTFNHGNFGGINLMAQNDLNRDDFGDMLYRVSNGDVFWDHFNPALDEWESKLVAKAWGSYKQILTPGDVTGDDLPDMLAVNSAGKLYIYPGKGNGGFAAPVLVGSGWGQYGMVRGHGDFTGDGNADLLARASDGQTYLYKGTGNVSAAFAPRVLVGAFSSMNALVTTGDVNSDGNADLLARDTTGKLWLYPGNGKSTGGIFATRVAFGTGWQAYNLFG